MEETTTAVVDQAMAPQVAAGQEEEIAGDSPAQGNTEKLFLHSFW